MKTLEVEKKKDIIDNIEIGGVFKHPSGYLCLKTNERDADSDFDYMCVILQSGEIEDIESGTEVESVDGVFTYNP